MQHKKIFLSMITLGVLLVIATGIWLGSAQPASAQCGSSASSCKNCHEVQAQMPVNNDGTDWHQSHAFGDFCYICHAGNNQSMVETEAHAGMVPPLSDIQASCQQCHPSDLQEKAQVYADLLGVEIGSGDSAGTSGSETPSGTSTQVPADDQNLSIAPAGMTLDVDDPNLVDYARRYDEIVLGRRPVNWGNVILIAMIAMIGLGGGAFVLKNEKLFNISFGETSRVEGEYPRDVVDLLPAITALKPPARRSLKNILAAPGRVEKVLALIEAVVSEKKDKE